MTVLIAVLFVALFWWLLWYRDMRFDFMPREKVFKNHYKCCMRGWGLYCKNCDEYMRSSQNSNWRGHRKGSCNKRK